MLDTEKYIESQINLRLEDRKFSIIKEKLNALIWLVLIQYVSTIIIYFLT